MTQRTLAVGTCPRCGRTDVPLMSGTFEGRVQLDAHTYTTVGYSRHVQCPGSFLLVTPKGKTDRDFRTERAAVAAINGARDAIGAALVDQFPEAKTGDEEPSGIFVLADAIQAVVRSWVADNVPQPLTLPEAVTVLIEARNNLRARVSGGAFDLNATLTLVQDALDRAPMTEDDLPRP